MVDFYITDRELARPLKTLYSLPGNGKCNMYGGEKRHGLPPSLNLARDPCTRTHWVRF